MDQMTYAEVIRIAQEAGFTVEPGQRSDVMWVVGHGNLSIHTLSKFAELIAERCEDIAQEGGYNCACAPNIRRKMAVFQ